MSSQGQQSSRKISKVRQACDCCHARKIRCDGTNPCLNCLSTELQCTYLAVPKKKGPKGRRIGKEALGKPISRPFTVPQVAASQANSPPVPESPKSQPQPILDTDLFNDPRPGTTDFQPSLFITTEIMSACLDAFFTHKYPITPILDSEEIFAILPRIHLFPEQYGLITACCAMIVLSPDIISPPPSSPDLLMPSSEFFISETIRARQYCNHIESPTLSTVHTSFFLFSALFCQGKDNSAWFYIREAMTMLQLLRLHEETTYITFNSPIYARRTFWLLFLTERAYALQRHRPLTLQRTIDLPTVDPNNEEFTIISGFLDLVSLFQNFDDEFLSLWNLSTTKASASPESLIRLQEVLKSALPHITQRTEIQQADLVISRQWLKTMVWQLCVTKGLLSTQSSDESMSFHYPVTIARDVVLVSQLLPPRAFEANGVGILEKVFDIGCSLADVLLLSRNAGIGIVNASRMEVGPRDYLIELVRLMGTVLGGSSKYLELLSAKADECLQGSVRGSLSSSEGDHGICEIEDDEELELLDITVNGADRVYEPNGPISSMNFQHPIMKGIRPNQAYARSFGPDVFNPFSFDQGQNDTYVSNQPDIMMPESQSMNGNVSSRVYEISTPQWDDMMETDDMSFLGTI